jgi:hypothetical protein
MKASISGAGARLNFRSRQPDPFQKFEVLRMAVEYCLADSGFYQGLWRAPADRLMTFELFAHDIADRSRWSTR